MQKIRLILSLFSFSIFLNSAKTWLSDSSLPSQNLLFDDSDIELEVPIEKQETSYYCVIAVVRSFLIYYGFSNPPSQDELYQEITKITGKCADGTIELNQVALNYLTNLIKTATGKKINYYFNNDFPFSAYGLFYDDLENFSTYVYNSLSLNSPVLFGYMYQKFLGHEVIISGIQKGATVAEDKYILLDPGAGGEAKREIIFARDLYQLCIYGFAICGAVPWQFPARSSLIFSTENLNFTLDNLHDNQYLFLGLQEINLNDFLVITEPKGIKKTLQKLTWPEFQGKIERPNQLPKTLNNLEFLWTNVPSQWQTAKWTSRRYLLDKDLQKIGCETLNTNYYVTFSLEIKASQKIVLALKYEARGKVTRHRVPSEINDNSQSLKGSVTVKTGAQIAFWRMKYD